MTSIFNKQYVFSSNPLNLPEMKCQIIGGCFLYTNHNLHVKVIERIEGKLIIIGNAYDMKHVNKSVESICSSPSFKLHEDLRFWTGRWTVVSEKEIINDASGLMPLFYGFANNNWYVSSSLAVIAQMMNIPNSSIVKHEGFDWQLLPCTVINGVKQALPFQYFQYCREKLNCCENNWMKNYTHLSTDEKCDKIIELLKVGIININKDSPGKIVQALTGGKDSRVVFGALIKAEVEFSTYTTSYAGISHSDIAIPEKISKNYRKAHRLIKPMKESTALLSDYDQFTLENIKGADRLFYACGQFGMIQKGSVIIRSGLFEAGQVFARTIARDSLEFFCKDIVRYYPVLSKNQNQNKGLELWKEYVQKNKVEWIDIRDRFYIDQRVGGWVSAIEQSLDMNDFISIQIANCAELLSILVSASKEEREKLSLTYRTLEKLDKNLLNFPINSVSVHDRIRRIYKALANPEKIRRFVIKNIKR